jgi:hypothetical protein
MILTIYLKTLLTNFPFLDINRPPQNDDLKNFLFVYFYRRFEDNECIFPRLKQTQKGHFTVIYHQVGSY